MRASMILVVIGAALALLGAGLGSGSGEPGYSPTAVSFGLVLVSLGGITFAIGILVELFGIGNVVRKIAENTKKIA